MQQNYKDTLMEIQESFYFFKSEAMDQISDDELIEFMKKHFHRKCQGSIEYLSGTNLEKLLNSIYFSIELKLQELNNPKEVLIGADISKLL